MAKDCAAQQCIGPAACIIDENILSVRCAEYNESLRYKAKHAIQGPRFVMSVLLL